MDISYTEQDLINLVNTIETSEEKLIDFFKDGSSDISYKDVDALIESYAKYYQSMFILACIEHQKVDLLPESVQEFIRFAVNISNTDKPTLN